ncbi:universal stress protein [Hymenobacter sp. 15J16-1T3B]|uniref:universal stress protein n=1 Tax=Hymenobacter sp. 15J16-1T3B TaxID=2886941 RepID=UPI001D0F5F53|nr:universal stress protein [Hymenobacter sp. 15J16-1T3B]MCC3157014.1 universal stress protein [Hymenobacter sp. 15J16-1T3B]
MDTLVVLTNLSPAAERARRYAAQLAGPLGARVVLLHVYQPPVVPAESGLAVGDVMYYDRQQVTETLQGIAADMLVPTTAEVVDGAFGDALEAAVARYQPLLLVLGLSSAERYFDALLTNRALPLLRHSPYPALLVPETAALLPPRRVVVGIDGEPFVVTAAAGGILQELLGTWQAAPTLVYTSTPESSRSRNEVLRNVQRSGLLPLEAEIDFSQPLAETPEEGVLSTASAREANLLVLLARRRSFLGQLFHRSVTARVLRRAALPVLLLPVAEPVAATATPATTLTDAAAKAPGAGLAIDAAS